MTADDIRRKLSSLALELFEAYAQVSLTKMEYYSSRRWNLKRRYTLLKDLKALRRKIEALDVESKFFIRDLYELELLEKQTDDRFIEIIKENDWKS
jgi:hypothetical protein